jgi:hypothetical protein
MKHVKTFSAICCDKTSKRPRFKAPNKAFVALAQTVLLVPLEESVVENCLLFSVTRFIS